MKHEGSVCVCVRGCVCAREGEVVCGLTRSISVALDGVVYKSKKTTLAHCEPLLQSML